MMRQFFRDKRFILLLAVIALGILLMLASGLRNLEFNDGRPIGWFQDIPTQYAGDMVSEFVEVPLWKQAAFWLLLTILIILVASLLSPEMRKRFLRTFLSFILTVLVFSYLIENNLINIPQIEAAESSAGSAALQNAEELPPVPEFTPPNLPDWANYLISLGITLVFLSLAWFSYRWWQRLNRRYSPPDTLKDLASIARKSLSDLSAGADWADAITNCYVRMSDVVSRRRGLSRKSDMTPAEFARRLERAGLPSEPVRRLTRLFESVRYGARKPANNEIKEAVSCLNAILQYCGEEA